MVTKKWPIPAGFTWNHVLNTYLHRDGRCWDSDTDEITTAGTVLRTVGQEMMDKALMEPPVAVDAQESVEQMIQRHGLEAPRVTPADIEAVIDKVEFHRPTGTLMLCVITLKNGFMVTGESACASPENFKQEVGERVSRDNAVREIWPLLGYQLRQKLHEGAGK